MERAERAASESAVREWWDTGDMSRATTALLLQLGPEILRYLMGTLAQPAVADDAYSLFCERVLTSLPRFEWRCSVRTWAYTLAKRSSVDALRAEGRRDRRRAPLSDAQVAAIAEQVRTTTLPLLRTEGKSAFTRLRDALAADDRALLVLRVDRGLPWADLARIFLDEDSPAEAELRRESARLRQRFLHVKARLREMARDAGLLPVDKSD
jgi:RNA polymerase sigma-70 factor (ECF subfamily)